MCADGNDKPTGVILLGGTGSRVRHATGGTNKHLIRIGAYTLAEHALNFLTRSGITEIIAVSSPTDRPALEATLNSMKEPHVDLRWALQQEPFGTAHAVDCAGPLRGQSDAVVLFGDNLFELPQLGILDPLPTGVSGRIFISRSSRPQDFGVVTLTPDGGIAAIDCKPAIPAADTVCTGLFCFSREALEILPDFGPEPSGEVDLMSLVREVWRRGGLSSRLVSGNWTDAASHADAIRDAQHKFASRLLLVGSPVHEEN